MQPNNLLPNTSMIILPGCFIHSHSRINTSTDPIKLDTIESVIWIETGGVYPKSSGE